MASQNPGQEAENESLFVSDNDDQVSEVNRGMMPPEHPDDDDGLEPSLSDDNSVQPGDFAENDSTESEEEQCSTEDEEDGLPAGIEVPLVIIQRLRSLKDDCRRKQQKIRELKERVRQLEEQLRSKNGLRPPPVPWQTEFRKYRRGEADASSWEEIYRMACKQNNMSMVHDVTHPDLRLVERVISDDILALIYPPVSPEVQAGETLLGPPEVAELPYFPFQRLPHAIQVRILRMIFVKPTLIHCLSRLDKWQPPLHFPEVDDPRRSGLLHRFHIGTNSCCVTLAHRPNTVLRPLLVCKRWLYLGVHLFYGANTFAFSSLGEMGMFLNGIGRARVERIQNIELMWHGNLMHPGAKVIKEPNSGRERIYKVSKRTRPLLWFTQTRRLKTLLVHLAESDPRRVRRPYEMKSKSDWYKDEKYYRSKIHNLDPFGQMVKRTSYQPNFRKYRSLYTLHGVDMVMQLRGMKWIRFKDTFAEEPRTNVRDWAFLELVNQQCTQPKNPYYAMQCLLENLTDISGLGDG